MSHRFVVALAAFTLAAFLPDLAHASDAEAPPTSEAPAAVEPPAGTMREESVASRIQVAARLGMTSSTSSSDAVVLAPTLGIGIEGWLHRNVGVALRYDASVASRGTSEVTVTRVRQQLAATVDGRLLVGRYFAVHAGIGGGGALLLATTSTGSDSHAATELAPALAWLGSLEIAVPATRLTATLGASGLAHRTSHDVLWFAGLKIALD